MAQTESGSRRREAENYLCFNLAITSTVPQTLKNNVRTVVLVSAHRWPLWGGESMKCFRSACRCSTSALFQGQDRVWPTHIGVGTAWELQTQLLTSPTRTRALVEDTVACSWPLKASYFRLGSQNLWVWLGKRRGDKAKWYL